MTDDTTKEKQVYDKQEGTKHRTLGDTLRQRSNGGGAVFDVNEQLVLKAAVMSRRMRMLRWPESEERSPGFLRISF